MSNRTHAGDRARTDGDAPHAKKPAVRTDGGSGAIDNDFSDAEQSTRSKLKESLEELGQTDPMAGGVAFDLVTRQPLFVRGLVANTLVEYYDREGFDLATYKTHPYLPVRLDDTVYECVFIASTAERAHKPGKTYDFPRGRLMHVPIEQAWLGGDDDA